MHSPPPVRSSTRPNETTHTPPVFSPQIRRSPAFGGMPKAGGQTGPSLASRSPPPLYAETSLRPVRVCAHSGPGTDLHPAAFLLRLHRRYFGTSLLSHPSL